jgi:hypothetical protein
MTDHHTKAGRSWLQLVVVMVAVALGVVLLNRRHDSRPVPAPTATATSAAMRTIVPTPAGTPAPDLEPAFTAGRYARLGSFRDKGRANKAAGELKRKGVDAQVISSDTVRGTAPGSSLLVAGPLAGNGEERRLVLAAKRAGVSDAPVKTLAPVRYSVEPADLAGEYSDSAQQFHPKVRRIPLALSLIDTGELGTITYGRPNCQGTLSFASQNGAVASYHEAIDSGRCTQGGTWSFKREDGHLHAMWSKPGDQTFIVADFKP